MMSLFRGALLYVLVAGHALPAFALDAEAVSGGRSPYAVPTFECIGVYYETDEVGACAIRYRAAGQSDWRDGLDLVYDPRDGEYRGSLVGLQPDTAYEIELACGGRTAALSARTRSDTFPIGKTTYLDNGMTPEALHITESGRPGGYHLVTPRDGAKTTVNVRNTEDYTAVIDADYVILRGVEFENAAIHGILIKEDRHDIVIEDCHVTFWGRIGGPRTFGNVGGSDSAVYAETGAGNLTIQRNLLNDPRGASNDWETGHPSGPQAISLINSSGGNVIRYNEIKSSEDHGYNDAIGGSSNFSWEGSPNRDSDIYGNIIRNVWDDAIESEGANMNVRIWENYIDQTFQFIATAATSKGPVYIYRNVFARSRRTHRNPIGGSMFKTGERNEFKGGRRYVFHNTALQPQGALDAFGGRSVPNLVTRNNVFDCPGRLVGDREPDIPSDYDYDFYSCDRGDYAQEPNGVRGRWTWPMFVESYSLEFYPAPTMRRIEWGKIPMKFGDEERIITDPVVTVKNPLIDGGVHIPNFNDDFAGDAPDIGAFELGRAPLRFGRRAMDTPWAPWELDR
jgi:hypothetical protein